MVTLTKINPQEIALPPVREVSLLTVAEFEKYGEYIPFIEANWELTKYSDYFYLLDEAEDGAVYYAKSGCDVGTDMPGIYDFGPDSIGDYEEYGTGTRPAIRFSEDILGANTGDQVMIGSEEFTVLAPDIILLNTHISTREFDNSGSNIYSEAEIKNRVDNWFENSIKPYL